MADTLPTSLRLSGDLAERIASRQRDSDGTATVIRRDLERYYRLLDLIEDGVAKTITLDQGLILVGERPLKRRSRTRGF